MAERICFCGQTEVWHQENSPQHAFFEKSSGGSAVPFRPKENKEVLVKKGVGGDPALRLALIDAGVLSYEQLALAEEKLNVARESGKVVFADGSAGSDPAGPSNGSPANP